MQPKVEMETRATIGLERWGVLSRHVVATSDVMSSRTESAQV
jgi:hypothetical protein